MEKRKEISQDKKRNTFLLISIVLLIGIYFLYNINIEFDSTIDKIKEIDIGKYMVEDSTQTNSTTGGATLTNKGLSMLMISVFLFGLSIIVFIVPLFKGRDMETESDYYYEEEDEEEDEDEDMER